MIKGNNLLALYSLKSQFAGSVKLIYIDPPYNTGNDEFKYNDNFNHSTWLTFMKNRLEVAYDFLNKDGVIVIQTDDNQVHYLKVLCDEIFGKSNFVNSVTVKMSETSGRKMAHVKKRLPKIKEHLLIYKKQRLEINPIKVPKEEWDNEYNKVFKNFTKADKRFIDSIIDKTSNGIDITQEEIKDIDKILGNVEVVSMTQALKSDDIQLENDEEEYEDKVTNWRVSNSYRIFRTAASTSVKKLADEKKVESDNIYFSVLSSRDKLLYIVKSDYADTSKNPRVQVLFAEDYLSTYIGDIWMDISTTGLEAEGGVELKNGKKPEMLISRIMDLFVKEGERVLDFFSGSGTTCAVAHKKGIKYIGVEQLDYGENDSVQRLINVINGEENGISSLVDWKGGGEFIYCELTEWNEKAKKIILEAENYEHLKEVFLELSREYFLNYNLNVNKFINETIKEENFLKLSLEEQKEIFLNMLDLNQLYVSKSEMEDDKFGISDEDIRLTKEFYEGGE